MTVRRFRVATAATLALGLVAWFAVDRPFATAANGWHRPALGVDLTYLADVPAPLATAALVVASVAGLAGWRPGPRDRSWLAAAIATLLALALKDELKWVFGRPWPDTWIANDPSWIRNRVFGFFPFHGGPGYASFPSGHATAISAPCAALWRAVPRARPLAAVLVLAVAGGLLASDYHFPSDVLAGCWLGTVVAYAVASLMGA